MPLTAARNLLVTVVSPTSVTVTWDAPVDVGAGVIRYRLYLNEVLIKETPPSIRTVTTTVTGIVEPFDVTVETVDADGTTTLAVNQSPQYFVKWMGSSSPDTIGGGTIDADGNIYIYGTTATPINFGNNTGSMSGGFFAKFNRQGLCLMAKPLGVAAASSITIDASNNIYISANFTGADNSSYTFGGDHFPTIGRGQMAIVKYDVYGNHLWSRVFHADGYYNPNFTQDPRTCHAAKVVIGQDGNPVLVGHFNLQITFDEGETYWGDFTFGMQEGYITKFNAATGATMWTKAYNAVSTVFSDAVVDHDGSIVLKGWTRGSGAWTDGPTLDPPHPTPTHALILKVDGDGVFLWGKIWGYDFASCFGTAVTVDGDNNVYSGGFFFFAITIEGQFLQADGFQNAYWVKLDPDGELVWVRRSTGTNHVINSMAIDSDGNLVFGGTHNRFSSFGGSQLVGNTSGDGMVVKYSPSGTHLYSVSYGGSPGPDSVQSVLIDGIDWVVLGMFSGECTIDGVPMYSWGPRDMFMSRRSGITS